MEAQEAKIYNGEQCIKSLCLIGYNDELDEIFIEPDGTMTVTTIEDVEIERGRYESQSFTYKGVTRISFK